jgi:hypothetical protein
LEPTTSRLSTVKSSELEDDFTTRTALGFGAAADADGVADDVGAGDDFVRANAAEGGLPSAVPMERAEPNWGHASRLRCE